MKKFGLLLCVIFSCCKHQQPDLILPVINLVDSKRINLYTEDLFERIEYVKLETSSSCLLGRSVDYYVTENYIITTSFSEQVAYLFDRKSGNFIKQIGQKGRGPDEYMQVIRGRSFDEENLILYCDTMTEWIGYQIESGEIKRIKKPQKLSKQPFSPVNGFIKMDSEDKYLGFVNNHSGSDPIRLIIFDGNGEKLKRFPNYQKFKKKDPYYFNSNQGEFYRYDNNLFFKEPIFNDTIFRFDNETMYPYATFFLGKYTPTYKLKESSEFDMQDYYGVGLLGENVHHIFFTYWYNKTLYHGFYNKKIGQTFVTDKGYLDNIDNMGYFSPITMTVKGELIGVLSAYDAVNLTKNVKTLPENIQHLSNIKEEDNPIVVIAKLKQ